MEQTMVTSHKKRTKIWLLILALLPRVSFSTFATDQNTTDIGDCFLLNTNQGDYSTFISQIKWDPLLSELIFPEENLKLAFTNLHAQCCDAAVLDQNSPSCQSTKNNRKSRTNFPQSTLLIDHLIDVQIRSWKSDTNYPGIKLDPQFKKRRDNLQKTFIDPKGSLPSTFTQDYLNNRSFQTNYQLPRYLSTSRSSYITLIRNQKVALNNASSRNFRTKYYNTCALASYFTSRFQSNTAHITTSHAACMSLISDLLSKETQLLKNIITYKSNKYGSDTLQEYGLNYFGSRLDYLQTTLQKTTQQFISASKQISHLTPTCN